MLSSAEDRIVGFSPPEVQPGFGYPQTLVDCLAMDLVAR